MVRGVLRAVAEIKVKLPSGRVVAIILPHVEGFTKDLVLLAGRCSWNFRSSGDRLSCWPEMAERQAYRFLDSGDLLDVASLASCVH